MKLVLNIDANCGFRQCSAAPLSLRPQLSRTVTQHIKTSSGVFKNNKSYYLI